MIGQYIELSGVRAPAGALAPRIDMTDTDLTALSIPGLKHVVAPRTFAAVAGGGITGKCRMTNQALVTKGSQTALLVRVVANKPALAISVTSAGQVGLALPEGSLTESYTILAMVNIGAAALAQSSPCNLISGFDAANTWVANPLRYNGAGGTPADGFSARGGDTLSTYASVARVPGEWSLLVIDYNNATRVTSIGINSSTALAKTTKPSGRVPAATDALEIGYHLSASSLRDCAIGDVFVFGTSVLSSEFGAEQIAGLAAKMKAEYGVA